MSRPVLKYLLKAVPAGGHICACCGCRGFGTDMLIGFLEDGRYYLMCGGCIYPRHDVSSEPTLPGEREAIHEVMREVLPLDPEHTPLVGRWFTPPKTA